MEARHDLPTLHRPVSPTDFIASDTNPGPLPTPPHKLYSGYAPDSKPYSYGRVHTWEHKYGSLPVIMTPKNWQVLRANGFQGSLPCKADYDESYRQLSSRKAYRYPHPGIPKARSGCNGGTWRHMKEAIGTGPGRLMWVDGVVSLYDQSELNCERPVSPENPACSLNPREVQSEDLACDYQASSLQRYYSRHPPSDYDLSKPDRWYSSNQPQPSLGHSMENMRNDMSWELCEEIIVTGKIQITKKLVASLKFSNQPRSKGPPGKYKGSYSMRQTY